VEDEQKPMETAALNGKGTNAEKGAVPGWVRALAAVERGVSVLLLGLVLGLMSAQVVARYLFRSPIAWSEELARFALIWLAFVAAGWVMAERGHLVVDLVSRRLSRRGRMLLDCAACAVVVVTCFLLLPAGAGFAWQMGGIRSSALGIPMSWWYFAPVTGLGLIALHSMALIVTSLRRGYAGWDEDALPAGASERGGSA
jgi:TRAP-type transport system small permease protein